MVVSIPVLKQNNGTELPVIGLGTWAAGRGEVVQAVKDAIDCGYRHFDCAYLYGNEKEVGEGIRAKLAEGVVKREDLFITTKLWNTYHPYDQVIPACKKSLNNLGLDYVDLYLIHWPFAWKEGDDLWPMKNGENIFSDVDYLDTWKGMEDCVQQGLTKSIGLSNFNSEQITRILANSKIKPVNNQIEVNPQINQKKLIQFCREKDITVVGYCPLGRPSENISFINDKRLIEIAKKYCKTPAQITLKYLLSLGISVIPKSANKKRIIENISIFDFELKPEDIATLDTFNTNYRICGFEESKNHKYYPFHIEY